MPYINVKTNTKISLEKEIILKTKLGKAIELIPGKSEKWLMLCFEDNCRLFFKGNNSEYIAFVEVKIFGAPNDNTFNNLTKEITSIIRVKNLILKLHRYMLNMRPQIIGDLTEIIFKISNLAY